jgi:hypothetical protein
MLGLSKLLQRYIVLNEYVSVNIKKCWITYFFFSARHLFGYLISKMSLFSILFFLLIQYVTFII